MAKGLHARQAAVWFEERGAALDEGIAWPYMALLWFVMLGDRPLKCRIVKAAKAAKFGASKFA